MQIVIAWAEKTKMVPAAGHVVRDGNLFPKFRFDWEGRAAMWLADGTEIDLEKACTYAAQQGHSVFTFPAAENDPLEKARCQAALDAKGRE